MFQGPQMSKCRGRWPNHSCKDERGRGSLPGIAGVWPLGHRLVLQPLVWNEPHPITGSQCLAAKEIQIQGPGPAIRMRWIRTFYFPGACVCPSPEPQPLECVEKGEDKGPFLLSPPELPTCSASLSLSLESTAQKHVSFTLKRSFTSISSRWQLEQNGNLCLQRGSPKWAEVGRRGHSPKGLLCREIPAAGSELEINVSRSRKQMKNS